MSTSDLSRIGANWSQLVFGTTATTTGTYGTMNVANLTWNHNVKFLNNLQAVNIAGANVGAHNLTIETNGALNINGNLTGSGILTIAPQAAATTIGVGDGQTGALALSNTELDRITDGWGNVTFGGTSIFGHINIGAYTWVNPVTFVSQGNIIVNGAQTSAESSGTTLVFATTAGSFVNNVGPAALDPGGGRYLVYSVASAADTLNGLTPLTVVNDESYSSYPPSSVTEPGDVFIYSGLAAKILFLSIDDVEKAYGDANPAFSFTYLGGLQGTDTLGDVILGYTLSAPGSNVLDAAGTTRTITGVFTAGLGYTINVIDGILSVVKAILTVTADSDSREYGETNPALTVSYSGFKNGEDVNDLDTEATAVTLADEFSDAGDYAITASGAAADNYDFAYQNGVLTVGKATLTATVTGSGTREYGEANPVFGIVYTGFVNGDDDNDIDTLAAISAPGASANAGLHAVTASGAFDNNYIFTYVAGSLDITKATLIATADDVTREVGEANPAFTITYTGFKNGEDASVIDTPATASTLATSSSPEGDYVISPGGALDNNYDFIYADGMLTVTPAAQPPAPPPPKPANPPPAGNASANTGKPSLSVMHSILNPRYSEAIRVASSSTIFIGEPGSAFLKQGSLYEMFFMPRTQETLMGIEELGLAILPDEALDYDHHRRHGFLIGIARSLVETP